MIQSNYRTCFYTGSKMRRKIQWYLTFALLALADHHESHDHGEHSADHPHNLHHGKDEPHLSHDGKDDSCHKLSPHNADFTFTLYYKFSRYTDGKKGKNIFFSPLSISMALFMLGLGAKGESHSQIFSTLGYNSFTED